MEYLKYLALIFSIISMGFSIYSYRLAVEAVGALINLDNSMESNIKIFPDEALYFMAEDGMYVVKRKRGLRYLFAWLFKRQLHEIHKISKM